MNNQGTFKSVLRGTELNMTGSQVEASKTLLMPLLPIHSRRTAHIFYEWMIVNIVTVVVYTTASLSASAYKFS